jgi:altronate dehydratase
VGVARRSGARPRTHGGLVPGIEHLLIRRAINEGVAKKLIDRYKWWAKRSSGSIP